MANVFGTTPPKIYLDTTEIQLPKAARGGRDEDFRKEVKTWIDLNNEIQQRVRGFRLICKYRWDYVSATEMVDLISINNFAGIIKLKFSVFPRYYPVRVSAFRHGLADGLSNSDAVELEFEGLQLLKYYPTEDLFYDMAPNLGRGIVMISLAEQ